MTNKSLVSRYEKVHMMMSKYTDKFNDAWPNLRYSEIRKLDNLPNFAIKFFKLQDEATSLRMEAERRYGPGLITVSQLNWK